MDLSTRRCNTAAGTSCTRSARKVLHVQARTSQQEADTETAEIGNTLDQSRRFSTPSIARRPVRQAVSDHRYTPRPMPIPPQPVPVIHSSAYQQTLVQSRMSPSSDDEAVAVAKTGTVMVKRTRITSLQRADESYDGTAIERALLKADVSLDEMEANPSAIHRAVYSISRGPVGTATTSAVQAAAKLTIKATVEAAKAAAPIGKWALAAGAKAAGQLLKAALVESVKNDSKKKEGTTKTRK